MKQVAILSLAIFGCWLNTARADDQNRPLEENLLMKVAKCDNAIIEVSKLADTRAASPEVKGFAIELIDAHKKCHDRVAEVIKNRKIAIVSGFEKEVREDIDRLGKLNGKDFDREYLTWIIKVHQTGIPALENQATNGKDAEIRTFANDNIKGMREHLKKAETLSKNAN